MDFKSPNLLLLIAKKLFSRRIIYQILVSYLQMFNNFGNLFRVAGKLGLVGYDRFFFHFFSYVH